VLMLAQQHGFSDADDRTREPFIASFAGFVLLGTILTVVEQTYPELHRLERLTATVDAAASAPSFVQIDEAIGNQVGFLSEWSEEVHERRNGFLGQDLDNAVMNMQEELMSPRRNFDLVQADLKELKGICHKVLDDQAPKALPAANVAGLGYLLYSKHLLAVEIAGTLLLVATIGAIAIAHRRPEPSP
jgi:hypothetical protein